MTSSTRQTTTPPMKDADGDLRSSLTEDSLSGSELSRDGLKDSEATSGKREGRFMAESEPGELYQKLCSARILLAMLLLLRMPLGRRDIGLEERLGDGLQVAHATLFSWRINQTGVDS